MEGAYLPGNIRQRMQELMKEHKITQAQLATRIGSTESAISRFVSGKTDKISTEHLLRIAKVFEVSTDFLLGEVNTPDRTKFLFVTIPVEPVFKTFLIDLIGEDNIYTYSQFLKTTP
ncbi:helix-turn-helix domain-containing protein [Enterocloster bolteae]|uniref:helix-turn-helix domain-containing protein n=1 Tax=Enterocloster bolteae TaxID=208479 RepID=UPI0026773B29|nr:helix-turn-helix transcriptional regulator [Enterocloster bolteae]